MRIIAIALSLLVYATSASAEGGESSFEPIAYECRDEAGAQPLKLTIIDILNTRGPELRQRMRTIPNVALMHRCEALFEDEAEPLFRPNGIPFEVYRFIGRIQYLIAVHKDDGRHFVLLQLNMPLTRLAGEKAELH